MAVFSATGTVSSASPTTWMMAILAHSAEPRGEGHEDDLTEMVEGVPAVARVFDEGEGFEACRETSGIVDLVSVSGYSGRVNPPDASGQAYLTLSVVSP
jgi:hypothetical protein